ncbi:MAG: signal peptidase II [Lentisphaerae bacterium]|nr:signal peptidase II [Lentisphaerota bacterium]
MRVLAIAIAVVLLDQTTKEWVLASLRSGPIVVLPGLLDFHYVQNTGAAWGMLQGFSHLLVALSFVMLACLIIFRRKLLPYSGKYRIVLGLLAGGIIGNLIDRVRLSFVVDFIYFHWKEHYFPAFNIADMAICTGVGLYMLLSTIEARAERKAADGGATGQSA